MSDVKKYYYLKIPENYFDRDNIRVLESVENGYIYSTIILKLYLKSLKYNGRLMMTDRIPYDPEKLDILAKVINHDIDHIRAAIQIAKDLDLIRIISTGEIFMLDIQNFIGKSSSEADRKRAYRAAIEKRDKCPDEFPPEIELEIEIKESGQKRKKSIYPDMRPMNEE